MERQAARFSTCVLVAMAGAAATATFVGAGAASAVVTGNVTFKSDGMSVAAVIDAQSDGAGNPVLCRLDVTNHDQTSLTKAGFKTLNSVGRFRGTLRIDGLVPGKYDAKVRCSDSSDPNYTEFLSKTGVVTVALPVPGVTPAVGTTGQPTPPSGLLEMLKQFVAAILSR